MTGPVSLRRAIARLPAGGGRHCIICERSVGRFLPYRGGLRDVPPLLRELEWVGSDVEHYECPACSSHDRERHLLLYLRAAGLLDRMRGARILHFAPERHLPRFLRAALPAQYVQADLHPGAPSILPVDLQAMPFTDGSFDIVLANHVLEHVADDRQALSEIRRVLVPGGLAILQTPFSQRLDHRWEDAGIQSDAARLLAYGQEDHCRLYGRDLPDFIVGCGFVARGATHAALLGDVDAARAGVNPREPFLLFERDADPAVARTQGAR